MSEEKAYDFAVSFSGKNREYVEQVVKSLQKKGITVFYDGDNEAELWGKNLHDYFTDLYQNEAKYVVIFISKDYIDSNWTNVERQAALANSITQRKEYVLPARFDDTEIPGILHTISFIDLRVKSPDEFADILEEKLRGASNKEKNPTTPQKSTIKPGAEDQNKKQRFEMEIQSLLVQLHQKKQDITIYRGAAPSNFERTLITGEAAFIEIINNFNHLKDEKKRYDEIKSVSEFIGEIKELTPCWIEARQYETIKRCVLYDIGVIKSWAATFYLAICRIDEYCEKTRTNPKKYIDLLESNLNRNEKTFLELSRNYPEYQQDDLIRKGFHLAEKHEIIASHCIIFDEATQKEVGCAPTLVEAEFLRTQLENEITEERRLSIINKNGKILSYSNMPSSHS